MSAGMLQFHCPACRARLRVRDQRGIDRQFACPECQSQLRIEIGESAGGVRATLLAAAKALETPGLPPAGETSAGDARARSGVTDRPTAAAPARAQSSPEPSRPTTAGPHTAQATGLQPPEASSRNRHWVPKVLLLMLAGGGALGLWIAWLNRPPLESPLVAESSAGDSVRVDPPAVAVVGDNQSPARDESSQVGGAQVGTDPAVVEESLEGRLESLGDRLDDWQTTRGEFPPGAFSEADLPEMQQFSWLALLAESQSRLTGPRVFLGQPWNDPVNDPFVRRRLQEYQNPRLRELTGADGYPATHFVGLAGVGPEALRRDAPANALGMFPPGRAVKPADVRDGLSNTILASGVSEHLGSWAAAGNATVRAYMNGPVVGGPEGFGTGDSAGMLVLMGDGRVQAVSRGIAPEIFRKLVTIADESSMVESEEPAAETVLVETADDPPQESLPGAEDSPRDDSAAERELPEPNGKPPQGKVQPIDIEAGLAQAILRFEQPSRPLADALDGIAELAGVPIRYDAAGPDAAPEGLKTRVTLSLRQTTVRAILEGLLAQGGMTFRIEADHILVIPRE